MQCVSNDLPMLFIGHLLLAFPIGSAARNERSKERNDHEAKCSIHNHEWFDALSTWFSYAEFDGAEL